MPSIGPRSSRQLRYVCIWSLQNPSHQGGSLMPKVRTVSRFALLLFVVALATTAISGEARKPSGRVTMESRSIAAGVGVTWGDGKLTFNGKDYPFTINGLSVVDWGISRASAAGDVYNLTEVSKFAGPYLPAQAWLTLAPG